MMANAQSNALQIARITVWMKRPVLLLVQQLAPINAIRMANVPALNHVKLPAMTKASANVRVNVPQPVTAMANAL